MEWSGEDMLSLIAAYRANTVLWNPGDPEYYKKIKKIEAWRDISHIIGKPEEDCKRKMISLLSSYRREKSREKSSQSGSEGYTSRWFAYESFQFLQDRKFRQNINSDTEYVAEGNVIPGHMLLCTQEESEDWSDGDKEFLSSPKRARRENDDGAAYTGPSAFLQQDVNRFEAVDQSEIQAFCTYLSAKMMTYSRATRQGVEHAIFDILIKADRGKYEAENNDESTSNHVDE